MYHIPTQGGWVLQPMASRPNGAMVRFRSRSIHKEMLLIMLTGKGES